MPHASHRHPLWKRVLFFFPFQLLVLHIKKNHFLLFFWLLLFAIATGVFASNFGVPQQFLVPEYRGSTGFVAFGIVGFAIGGFITGFNLYTYIMHGYRFPFIATLSRPFHKFSLNNFILPGLFILTYCISSAHFQLQKELIAPGRVVFHIVGLILGVIAFQSLSYVYFSYTNKDAMAFGKGRPKNKRKEENLVDSALHNPLKWFRMRNRAHRWHVETYMSSFGHVSLARDSKHYDKAILEKVFSQNHINAARFEIVLVLSFLIIGSFREVDLFIIPAAASALLFFTMLLMLVSALHSWIKGWTLTLFILGMVLLNFFYADLKVLRIENRAYGLNYETTKVPYNVASLNPPHDTVQKDIEHSLGILDTWRKKLNHETIISGKKPRLVILDFSGGGSRSAYWSMRSLAYVDSLCGNRLLDHTVLMTGASGGMVGASFVRELKLRQFLGENVDFHDPRFAEEMGKDLLNPIVLSVATNDWFLRYQKLKDGNYTYTKDRAWSFEKQLSDNTHGLFDKRLRDYALPEEHAIIPMMVLSPTIINDGRRLMISSQPISYLTKAVNSGDGSSLLPENIEFRRMFKDQDADNLRFISALRMNATFPYILPVATLPSEPTMEIMDAGVRDNFGLKTTLEYLYTFRDWINTNTSGVVIIQVRDLPKGVDLSDRSESLFSKLAAPVGSIYGNMTKTHDYNNEQMLEYLQAWFDQEIDLVTLQLQQSKETHVSLSWHLTEAERLHIRNATKDEHFQKEAARIKRLLE